MTDPAQAFLNHGNVDQWSWAHEPLGPNIPHMASWTSDDVPSILTNTTINTIKEVRDSTIQVFAEVAAALD